MVSRRSMLKGALWVGASPALAQPVFAQKDQSVILLDGVDVLSMVYPFRDHRYYGYRPHIAIPPPGHGSNSGLDLDGSFALHPALELLLPHFRAGHLTFHHACHTEAYTGSISSWNTSRDQGSADGLLARFLGNLAQRLDHRAREVRQNGGTAFCVIRRGCSVRENVSRGTDPGGAGLVISISGQTTGGRVDTDWPGLAFDQLEQGRFLKATQTIRPAEITDYG